MQSQMQSLDIRRPAERTSRVVASAILIDCPAATTAARPIMLSNCSNRPVPFYCSDCSTATILPTVTDRLLPTDYRRPSAATKISAIKSSAAGCPTAYYIDRALLPTVLLLTVLPLTVLFYLTTLTVCFYYCLCHYYYYCCYCCYCYRYYFWFTTVLVATSRKIGSWL